MRTPPYNLMLGAAARRGRRSRRSRGDRARSCPASSARSPRSTSSRGSGRDRTRVEPRILRGQGVYALEQVAAGPAAPGGRVADRDADDELLLVDWMVAFGEEVLDEDDPGRDRGRAMVDHRLGARRRRLPALGGRRRARLARRLGRPDPERDPHRPGLHAAGAPRPRLRDRARRRALAGACSTAAGASASSTPTSRTRPRTRSTSGSATSRRVAAESATGSDRVDRTPGRR